MTTPAPHTPAARFLALGRYWGSADIASMTVFNDCARNDFTWSDGAHVSMLHDTKEEAVEQMRGLGFGD